MGNICSDADVKEPQTRPNEARQTFVGATAPSPQVQVEKPRDLDGPVRPSTKLHSSPVISMPPSLPRHDPELGRTGEWSEPDHHREIDLEAFDIEPEGPITPARPPPPLLIENWLANTAKFLDDPIERVSPSLNYNDEFEPYVGTPTKVGYGASQSRSIFEVIAMALSNR